MAHSEISSPLGSNATPLPPSSPGTAGFNRLPPIITNPRDRAFLLDLTDFLRAELSDIANDELEQRYMAHQAAFNKIIDYVTAYKPLLSQIKQEYEDIILAIKTGQREAVFLRGKLKAMASEPSTLRSYRKRADELEYRISLIETENDSLKEQLKQIQQSRQLHEKKDDPLQEMPSGELKKDPRQMPGLTLEQSTDLPFLQRRLDKLERQLKDLTISFKTRYVTRKRKDQLKDLLNERVAYRDQLITDSEFMRAWREKLEIALEAAQAYNHVKPPHQTVGDTVVHALNKAIQQKAQEKADREKKLLQAADGMAPGSDAREITPTNASSFEDDDPNKDKEAELMLEYIEKFNELFEDGKYDEAAIHAANSPKGILRTQATLAKFRDVKTRINGRTPLLTFCDALMSSVPAFGVLPTEGLSMDAVRCVLNESQLDMLSHWLAQGRLTVCEEMGDMISGYCPCATVQSCRCGCQALAQTIYCSVRASKKAVMTMIRQGRVCAALSCADKKAKFTTEDYMHVLTEYPSVGLIQLLLEFDACNRQRLPFGVLMSSLLGTQHWQIILKYLQQLKLTTPTGVRGTMKAGQVHRLVQADHVTGRDKWQVLLKQLSQNQFTHLVIEIFAALTVREATRSALFIMMPSI